MALLTTTAGWFPKPVEVRRARWRFAEGDVEEDELRAVEARATQQALALQLELGLDVLVEGQLDRGDMAAFLAGKLEGLEPGGLVRCFGNRYYRKARIVGEIAWPGPLTVGAWQAAQRQVARPVKAVLTGPYTLMDWSFDEHYGSREACCLALAEALRQETAALLAAGVHEIQLDEPAISARPEEMALAAEALGRVCQPLRGKARSWAHVCYGSWLPVVDELFALPVDGLLLEMTGSGRALAERLGDLPGDKLLAAGVVDVQNDDIEDVATIRGRAERLLERVPSDRLWLAPDAGLRTLTANVAAAKLRALVQAAATLG